jgi:DNA modification methylase
MPSSNKRLPKSIKIYNDNCFKVFPKIEDNSVDLFILDLPYANMKFGKCTSCKWDLPIDLDKMWIEMKRILKKDGISVFFCNTKFGYALIDSNPKWFRYDLIWKKSKKVGFLSANKQPLRQHENIYIFKDKGGTYNPQKTKLEKEDKRNRTADGDQDIVYGENVKLPDKSSYKDRHPTSIIEPSHENVYIFKEKQGTYNPQKSAGKPYKQKQGVQSDIYGIEDKDQVITENKGDRHPTSVIDDWSNALYEDDGNVIEGSVYGDITLKHNSKSRTDPNVPRHPTSVLEHENMYIFKEKGGTYNPQMEEGKPYKSREADLTNSYYRGGSKEYKSKGADNKGTRHPSSIMNDKFNGETILEYKNPHKTIHKTQKPVDLLEWLIKTYSNEDDLIMDFTMGSASCGIACMNTNRKFIGVEMDKEIFKSAKERLINNISTNIKKDVKQKGNPEISI